MSSVYDNTSNIIRSDFREISLSDSGTFSLAEEQAKKITVFNDSEFKVRVYKTQQEAFAATTSGTSDATGVFIGLEDGISFTIPGATNPKFISLQKDLSTDPNYKIKYIIER